jgi:hypothetical protein
MTWVMLKLELEGLDQVTSTAELRWDCAFKNS